MAMTLDGLDFVFYDCEVVAYDWLFTFLDSDGGFESIWNDGESLKEYVEERPEAMFVGFNSSHYDAWILRLAASGADPEDVKSLNDWIIGGGLPWEHPALRGVPRDGTVDVWDVDLMKDTQVGTSLKSIEANARMSVEESSVPFDIDRPLTPAEREEMERYCRHDVEATRALFGMRRDYLATKLTLGERAGMEPWEALKLTNAKLTARVLRAQPAPHGDERDYSYPTNLLMEFIPPEAVAFFDRMHDPGVPDEELWSSKLEIDVGGCPVTLGFGGIHGAVPTYREHGTETRVLVNADVSSYYPSLMVKNGYISRNVPHPDVFKGIYEERLRAKAAGDKATANALKLVVNTTYGATLNQYNDLYDPLMARSVCVSGQLYLLELASHLVADVPSLTLIQLNTDGILFSVEAEFYPDCLEITDEWQARTGFGLEFDRVQEIVQRDVNNYAMRLEDGAEKVKGGFLVRGMSKAGAYSINENATVVADALKRYLLDGVPVEETVVGCDDPWAFQLVAKAGHKYARVYQLVTEGGEEVEREVQKCNRVYACRDPALGRLYKVKAEDGQVAKIESLPDHCLISNGAEPPDISLIDKSWYVELAEKRAGSFHSEEEQVATAEKTAAVDYSGMNVWQKLAVARKMVLDAGIRKGGYNDYDGWSYLELSDVVPVQDEVFAKVGLIELFTYRPGRPGSIVMGNLESGERKEYPAETPYATATVVNADAPDQTIEFRLPWLEIADIIGKTGKAKQNALQKQGSEQTYLRRYLKMQVLDLAVPDDIDSWDGGAPAEAPKVPAPAPEKPAPKPKAEPKPKKPPTEGERRETAAAVAAPDGAPDALQMAQFNKIVKAMREGHGDDERVSNLVADIAVSTNKGKDMTKAQCEGYIRALGELKAEIEAGA